MLTRMFHLHCQPTPTKSVRPLAHVAQKSTPKKSVRPLAYVAKKPIEKEAKIEKRPLALDPKTRAGKRAKLDKGRMNWVNVKMKTQSPIIPFKDEGELGSVHESDVAHWERHSEDPSSSTCCRCIYIQNKAEYWREHPWLSPRPKFMGGDWALGCDVCSWRHKYAEKENHKKEA
jgi:hypothetical protein